MVANLTQGKTENDHAEKALLEAAEKAHAIKERLVLAIDEDTQAFNAYMEARRLPQQSPDEKKVREMAMQEGLKLAVNVPWHTALESFHAIEVAWVAAQHGNPASITDAAVGAQMGFAGVRGGLWNVLINLKDITDKTYTDDMRRRCADLLREAEKLATQVARHVDEKLVPATFS
jgi:glutamate formiminotransferase/formiminotetrahydrofolate cyclodeaminase